MKKQLAEIQLRYDQYTGRFYRRNRKGNWYQFDRCGNTGVAFDIANMLGKLGHKVQFISEVVDDET